MEGHDDEKFYGSARSAARRQAIRYGLKGDAADDLEQSFVVRWLFSPIQPPIWTWPDWKLDPYLRRAARNHAASFLARMRAERALVDRCVLRMCEGAALPGALAAEQPSGIQFRELFWRQIRCGIALLRPGPAELFARWLSGESAFELAGSDRARHAIRQRLSQARRRVRSALTAQGNSESELRSYLPLIRPESIDCTYKAPEPPQ